MAAVAKEILAAADENGARLAVVGRREPRESA
jgi:hypothetical protein